MNSSKYGRLPQAGDFEENSGTEIFYLAPRPVPTGARPINSRKIDIEQLGNYIDFAPNAATLEFGIRGTVGSVMVLIILFFICSLVMTHIEVMNHQLSYFSHLVSVLLNPYFWSFITALVLMYTSLIARASHQRTKAPPARFNRQRREVAYVPKRGQPPRFIPWEEVIACVTSGKVVTQYGVHNSFSLMIGLRDSEIGDVVWITVPTGSLMLAVSEWETIRGYMEEGLSALPRPVSGEFEEGTVAYFHYCRQVYRDNHWYMTYLLGFVLVQFCSGWTLPCHIAAWVERLPKTSFPKSVLDWSKPLPPEEWKQPSEELLKQSEAVRKSLRRGKSLLDHFQGELSVEETNNA
ncbi:hypothetical protein QCD79_16075 [Pseudomonas quasicaspiana]|nr:hypothetical protein [Pseudomonas quasicaspiana]